MPVKHHPSNTDALRVAQVYDGRTPLGSVHAVAGGFVAITAIDESTIGVFRTLREAARAFDGGAS
jgi:hypothetical protein